MKVAQLPSDVLCTPHIDLHDCAGSTPLTYVAIVCASMSTLTFLLGATVIGYRWRHGILTALFRRIDGYWIPIPLDILIAISCPVEALRAIMYLLVMLDWPKSMIFRNIISISVLILMVFGLTLFVSGIIAHIPPMFARTTHATGRTTMTNHHTHDNDTANHRIFVPSIPVLFWITVIFCTQMLALTIGSSAVIGWSIERNLGSIGRIAHRVEAFSLAVSILVMFVVNGYYSYGFYRILTLHVKRSINQGMSDLDELDAARRFRNMFLAVIAACILGVVFAILSDVLMKQISRILWWNATFSIMRYGVVFPGIQWLFYYNVFQSSRARVRRTTLRTNGTRSHTANVRSNPGQSNNQLHSWNESTVTSPMSSRRVSEQMRSYHNSEGVHSISKIELNLPKEAKSEGTSFELLVRNNRSVDL
ncbi:hypothetical protein BDF22DRAFT_665232 [Syncephalis plumigaleata]|nr:hypothetical protein BDF22DRAFT_665232 [Syncephalis plumigaleata]